MLKIAQQYEDELQEKLQNTWFDEKYLYYHNGCWYADMNVAQDTQTEHQFVSVYHGDVIGYIGYTIDRDAEVVYDLNIINFSNNKLVFGKDVMTAIDDIFCKFKFNKIEFDVLIGNPAEKTYDKFIELTGGRIVGVYKNHSKLEDGMLYDLKMYELCREDYLVNRDRIFRL